MKRNPIKIIFKNRIGFFDAQYLFKESKFSKKKLLKQYKTSFDKNK